jgi:hypothetical protein
MMPCDEKRQRELRARGRRQRAQRIAFFAEEQRKSHDWINFNEIADWCARRESKFVPDEAARLGAYDLLRDDLLNGEFEAGGESHVLFLHPDMTVPMTTERMPSQARRMTREKLLAAIEMHPPELIRSQYLAHLWIPYRIFNRWLVKHDLPPSPSLFKPATKKAVSAIVGRETAATKSLAAYLRDNQDITRNAAEKWCVKQGFRLSQRGFRFRVWPAARKEAGLSELAPVGRKRKIGTPKSVRQINRDA